MRERDETIRGRKRIAHALGVTEAALKNLIARGFLEDAWRENGGASPLYITRAALERVKRRLALRERRGLRPRRLRCQDGIVVAVFDSQTDAKAWLAKRGER